MSGESETLEAPNWLSELEKKRENRLKARLGHEAGAGAPCIKCEERCPGLDLHFWRKICKNCKCSKEDHDVHDDDIYGWAQFQLLGSKPTKIKKKIVLPGKKDEVELDWTPKGNTETIDRYLKTLPPENLPVKGSQAAQDRKQLLQKQIPIHDIDPTLCHELTESELAQMQEYIKHMKSSAGVGQIVQFGGFNYGNLHTMGEANVQILSSRYPKGIPSIETVKLHGEKKVSNLTRQLDKMGLHSDPKHVDPYYGTVPRPEYIQAYAENLPHKSYNPAGQDGQKLGYGTPINYAEGQNLHNPNVKYTGLLGKEVTHIENNKNLPASGPTINEGQKFGYVAPTNYAEVEYLGNPDLAYPAALGKPQNNQTWGPGAPPINYQFNKNLQGIDSEKLGYGKPGFYAEDLNNPNIRNAAGLGNRGGGNYETSHYPHDLNKATQESNDSEKLGYGKPGFYAEGQDLNNPNINYAAGLGNKNFGDYETSRYPRELNKNLQQTGDNEKLGYGKSAFYAEGQDLNNPNLNYAAGLGNKSLGSGAREQFLNSQGNPNYPPEINLNMNLPHYAPTSFNVQSDQQNAVPVGNVRDLAYSTHHPNMDAANSNYRQLQSRNPSQIQVPEDQLVPNKINIGAIRDLTYENPEIRSAIQAENKMFDDYAIAPREKIPAQSQQCKKCSKPFKPDEFAIFVEKSNSLYHSNCFKCAGCNQNLADLFYFYDKEMDDVYCGRDFAKIRGIPRCKACDELIFVKEYCLAENSTFHLKHFCCFECDEALAGKNYVVEDSQPVCVSCFEKLKANKCMKCLKVIRPDEEGVSLTDQVHFHTYDECFCCSVCRKPLKGGAKLLFKNKKLYCSSDCYKSDQ